MIEQGSAEWFKERMGYCTASQFHHVAAKGAGKGRKDYMRKLIVERITQVPTVGFSNDDVRRGIELEPYAKMNYTAKTLNIVEDVGFVKHKDTSILAGYSPDGFVGEHGTVEIKCVKETVQLETIVNACCPKAHLPQIQGGMWITGRKWCDFVSYSPDLPDHLSVFVFTVKRSDADILYIERDVKAFLTELEEELEYFNNYQGIDK